MNPTPHDRDHDPMLADPEAAAMLGVSVHTLQSWRGRKLHALPYVRIGRAVRYRRSAIEAFIEANTVSDSPA